jgi:hypothetical protein
MPKIQFQSLQNAKKTPGYRWKYNMKMILKKWDAK